MRTLGAMGLMLLVATGVGHAQSQIEITKQAYADYEKADKKLNAVYHRVLETFDAVGQRKLGLSEQAWLAYRDAQAELMADQNRGGSLSETDRAMSMQATTLARVKELEAFLVPR